MTSTDWMDNESARIAGTVRQAEELGQQQLEASMAAQQVAPDFWNEFIAEAKVQADGLEKRFTYSIDEKIDGHCIVESPTPMLRDHSCTIIVDRHSMEFTKESVKFHFYYQPGSRHIKKSAWGQDDVFIGLYVGPQGKVAEVNGSSKTAKELAISLVKAMYESVKFSAIPKAAQR